ncbi:MAG: hypothetical protein QXH32_08425 [Candidatus Caldarchaeum sp.]
MELFRAVDCVEYVGPEPRIPALRITITDPVKERTLSLTAPLDTGFAGYILEFRSLPFITDVDVFQFRNL